MFTNDVQYVPVLVIIPDIFVSSESIPSSLYPYVVIILDYELEWCIMYYDRT